MPPRAPVSNTGTWLALFGLLIAGGLLLGLAAMVVPQLLGILLVGVGFLYLLAFHYVVWGRRMSAAMRETDPDESSTRADSDDRDG